MLLHMGHQILGGPKHADYKDWYGRTGRTCEPALSVGLRVRSAMYDAASKQNQKCRNFHNIFNMKRFLQ